MSLFTKFTSIFKSKPPVKNQNDGRSRLKELLQQVMCHYLKFDLKQSVNLMASFLTQNGNHIDYLFDFIAVYKPSAGQASLQLIQLLSVIHQLFHCQEIVQELSIKMRECRLMKLELENLDNILTEPDLITRVNKEQCYTEVNVHEDLLLVNFAFSYFTYLQRLAANIDLYRAVNKSTFPYLSEKDTIEPKLMFLWLYKLQNLLNSATVLLKNELPISQIQYQVYFDLWKFQKFICEEMDKVIDSYITFPNSDTLSLYEVFQESCRHYEMLKKFQISIKRQKLREPILCVTNNNIWQEFLNFIPKLKVLNQMSFKKSLKVPNKMNPCMGIPLKNPNVLYYNIRLYICDLLQESKQNNQMKVMMKQQRMKRKNKKNFTYVVRVHSDSIDYIKMLLLALITVSLCAVEDTKEIMQDWDKYMRGFLPDDMISFSIEKGGEEIFIESVKNPPTNIRGTFFIPIYTMDTIDFKVLDPSGSMIYAKMMKKEAVFSFNATDKGDYQLIFQNRRAKEAKIVQLAIDVAKSEKEEIEQKDIDPIENGVSNVLQKVRDVFYSTKLNEMKSKGALAEVQKINKQLMILTFIETVTICGVTAWQVYYIKKLLNDRRLV